MQRGRPRHADGVGKGERQAEGRACRHGRSPCDLDRGNASTVDLEHHSSAAGQRWMRHSEGRSSDLESAAGERWPTAERLNDGDPSRGAGWINHSQRRRRCGNAMLGGKHAENGEQRHSRERERPQSGCCCHRWESRSPNDSRTRSSNSCPSVPSELANSRRYMRISDRSSSRARSVPAASRA